MRSFDWKAGLAFALSLAASVAAPQDAFAQFFFRPFANIFHTQIPGEGPPAYASRPAVASILARTGFQLLGPLGRRGDQIVATGVSRRDGEMRFIIDPYAGRILRAVRLGPPPSRATPDAPPLAGGPGPAGAGFEAARDAGASPGGARLNGAANGPAQQRGAAAKAGASSKTSRAIVPPKPGVGPAVKADEPASVSPPPAKAVQDSPTDAKNRTPTPDSAEKAANPSDVAPATSAAKDAAKSPAPMSAEAKPESAGSGTAIAPSPSPSAQTSKTEAASAAAPQAPAVADKAADTNVAPPLANPAASAERSAPARRAAAARAASSRRAIVPPHTTSGMTVVEPAAAASAPPAAGANGSATAPDNDGKPNAGG